MLRLYKFILITTLFVTNLYSVAWANAKRIALVIGNSAYTNTDALSNPKNDSEDVAAALRKLGFEVVLGQDMTKAEMDRALATFMRSLSGASVGLFFYAGHGFQIGGFNYLVPVDVKVIDGWSLDFEMVKLDRVYQTMERTVGTNLLFVDACRDNPLVRKPGRSFATRSLVSDNGLAPIEAGAGSLISFSTQPGSVAMDGEGRNSPYVAALLKALVAPKDDISTLLIHVRNQVMRETKNRQIPWENSALTARFYFVEPAAAAVATGAN